MEHYYVITGNEQGADLSTKKNFKNIEDAKNHFEDVKFNDFASKIVHVDSSGIERDIEIIIND